MQQQGGLPCSHAVTLFVDIEGETGRRVSAELYATGHVHVSLHHAELASTWGGVEVLFGQGVSVCICHTYAFVGGQE